MQKQTATADWYRIHNIATIDSPALVVYRQRVQSNIDAAIAMIGDVARLRPHVKTHKSPHLTQMLQHGGLKKFKCATIAEAEMLAALQVPDVLLAYQPIGPKADRLLALIKRHPQTLFSCLVDAVDAAQQLSQKAVAAGVVMCVYIDLNVGMNRTGVAAVETTAGLYARCKNLAGVKVVGLHAYDGHITDSDVAQRTAHCNAAFALVEATAAALQEQGFDAPLVVAGGSGTFPIHARRAHVVCSPGTFVYWDAGYAALFPDLPFVPAALVVTRVVSLPDATTLCTDLGHKAIASENLLAKRVVFLNAPEAVVCMHSEEHLVLRVPAGHSFNLGDVLYGIPFHICPTCALYDQAVLVEQGKASGMWPITARSRTITI